MKPLLLFLLLSTAAWGQDSKPPVIKVPDYPQHEVKVIARADDPDYYHYDKPTISKSETVQQDTIPVTIKAELPDSYHFLDSDTARIYKLEWIPPVQQDTIPVTLLVRIQGRPWAFFHDGWEVRKVDSVAYMEPYWCKTEGCLVAHPPVKNYRMESFHLLYLDSRKRPIRKELVVYQTFKR